MPRINTRDAADYIAALEPFTSNGAIRGDDTDGRNFIVWSYGTPIAVIDRDGERVDLNGERYSTTTSKHQHAARIAARRLERDGYQVTEWDAVDFTDATGLHARRHR